jgi:hypothetical protein
MHEMMSAADPVDKYSRLFSGTRWREPGSACGGADFRKNRPAVFTRHVLMTPKNIDKIYPRQQASAAAAS